MLGRVKWYNFQKGYGFIISSENDKEYFVHVSEIKDEQKILVQDEQVEFTPSQNEKGLLAKDISTKKE